MFLPPERARLVEELWNRAHHFLGALCHPHKSHWTQANTRCFQGRV